MSAKKKTPPKPAPKKPVARKKKTVPAPNVTEVIPEVFEPELAAPIVPVTYRKRHGDGQWHRLGCFEFPTEDFAERSTLPASPLCPLCPTA